MPKNNNARDFILPHQADLNSEYPFTELLSLLKCYRLSSDGQVRLAYSTEMLQAASQHADNSIQLLLQGLQTLGYVLAINQDKEICSQNHVNNLGSLIHLTSNLLEALYSLRADITFELKQRNNTDTEQIPPFSLTS